MYYVCLCVYVLTRHSSEVNSLLASCRTALFGANTLLCGFIHMKLQDVVLHHHWRRAATTGQGLQQHDFNTGSKKSHRSVTLVQEKLTYDGVPVSVTQRFFRCEGGRELTFTTVHWHSHLHKHRFIITNSPKHYFHSLLLSHLSLLQSQTKVLIGWYPSMQQQPRVRDGSNL